MANAVSGVAVQDDCRLRFLDLKAKRNNRYIIFKIVGQRVVVEKLGRPALNYDDFTAALPSDECCYGVVPSSILALSPARIARRARSSSLHDTPKVRMKMVYASSKDRLKRELDGIQVELQATDPAEMSFDVIKARAF